MSDPTREQDERDLLMLELADEGLSQVEIARKLERAFPKLGPVTKNMVNGQIYRINKADAEAHGLPWPPR